ncbi:MAG TPA: hypothetical protein VK667_13320 [Ktedonobacteraceae bacterium]|nr:hypothetical protein [Ktedonobacteraceae bacterium]
MPNATILNSQRRQKDAGESVQYQEMFVGNAIALHTFSIIVTTAHPFQALAAPNEVIITRIYACQRLRKNRR